MAKLRPLVQRAARVKFSSSHTASQRTFSRRRHFFTANLRASFVESKNPAIVGFRRICQTYARVSNAYPYLTAGGTAFFVLGGADITAQQLECRLGGRKGGWDKRRTLALVCFGVYYYGGPCKFFYLNYPRLMEFLIPKASQPVKKVMSAMIDCAVVTPILLLPTFYLITFKIKGYSLQEAWDRYCSDCIEVTLGTFLFWMPICTTNFYFVPQHSQILVITICSFIHKTWLSWVSNRYSNKSQANWTYTGFIKSRWEALKRLVGIEPASKKLEPVTSPPALVQANNKQ